MTSLAFSALVLLIILLPGSIFIKSFFRSSKTKQNSRHFPFETLLVQGLLFSTAIHTTAACLFYLFGFDVDYQVFQNILLGDALLLNNATLRSYFIQFCSYSLLVCIFSFLTGKGFRFIVHRFKIHYKWSSLHTSNYWFEIFTGEFLERHRVPGYQLDSHILVIDILTNDKVIYSGYLQEYYYSPYKDELESIVLKWAKKKEFKEDGCSAYREISGDVFVVPYAIIKNINVYYLNLDHLFNKSTINPK